PRIEAVEVVVVADTHLRSGLARLPPRLIEAIAHSDAVVHAGDVVSLAVLTELGQLAPLLAVLGNNDHELVGLLPEELGLELGGVRVAVLHDSGPARGRPGRMAQRFPEAHLVIFGHSHVPVDEAGARSQWLFNPGSPTQRRAQPRPTFGRLTLEAGRVMAHTIEQLDPPAA
ncbi:MAG: metallophosphoesterase family protein, partial [Acidimicrobiales bacterium]